MEYLGLDIAYMVDESSSDSDSSSTESESESDGESEEEEEANLALQLSHYRQSTYFETLLLLLLIAKQHEDQAEINRLSLLVARGCVPPSPKFIRRTFSWEEWLERRGGSLGDTRLRPHEVIAIANKCLPPVVKTDKGAVAPGWFALYMWLFYYGVAPRIRDMVQMFRKAAGTISDLMTIVTKTLWERHGHLLTFSPIDYRHKFPLWADAVSAASGRAKTNVALFNDVTAQQCCKPFPAQIPENLSAWEWQKEYFSGNNNHRKHCLKYHTICTPLGLHLGCGDVVRRGSSNDPGCLNATNIQAVEHQMVYLNVAYAMYGDGAFAMVWPHRDRRWLAPMNVACDAQNRAMVPPRTVGVEVPYGNLVNCFTRLKFFARQKLHKNPQYTRIYPVAMLIMNFRFECLNLPIVCA